MKRTFKDDTKFHSMSGSSIAKELGISDDRVSYMNSNIGSVPLGRIIEAYDSMGGEPDEMMRSLSDNSYAHDGLSLPDAHFKATREDIGKIIKDADLSSEGCRKVKTAVDSSYRNPVIYVTGAYSCGKITWTENILNTKFRLLGSPLIRSFSHLLIMSDSSAGIEFNYPFGEYLYKLSSAKIIPGLMVGSLSEQKYSDELIPEAKEGISFPNDYVLYSDSPSLDSVTVICSNQINDRPSETDDAAEIEAEIISLSDVLIIMISAEGGFPPKLVQLLRCVRERWGYDMKDHVIFAVAKSDRYQPDEMTDIIQWCAAGLRSLMAQVIDRQTDESDKLMDDIRQMIFPYSSIYKDENIKGKNDAGFNLPFYQRLHDILSSACDDSKRRAVLLKMLGELKQVILQEKTVTHENSSKIRSEIFRITAEAENDFKRSFSESYDGIMDIDYISGIITDNNIVRKQEDRQKLVAIVDSQLINSARAAAAAAAEKIADGLEAADISVLGEAVENSIIDSVRMISKTLNAPSADISLMEEYNKEAEAEDINEIGRAFLPFGMAAGALICGGIFPISGIAAGITAAAGSASASYYAQTNFEKNMAKKIVFSYSTQGVKEKFAEKMILKYFRPLRDDLLVMTGSPEFQGDEKAAELIERIVEKINY